MLVYTALAHLNSLQTGMKTNYDTRADLREAADIDASLTTQAEGTWAAAGESQNAQTQNAYSLLMIVLIVVAAVVFLTVVKLL